MSQVSVVQPGGNLVKNYMTPELRQNNQPVVAQVPQARPQEQNIEEPSKKINWSTIGLSVLAGGLAISTAVYARKTYNAGQALNAAKEQASKIDTALNASKNQVSDLSKKVADAASEAKEKIFKMLFPKGVKGIEIEQQNVGDCYLLSALYGLSRNAKGQKIIENMITVLPDGSYSVKFIGAKKDIIVAASEVAKQQHLRTSDSDMGVKIIERAYSKLQRQMRNGKPGQSLHITGGGRIDDAVHDITGVGGKDIYTNSGVINLDKYADDYGNYVLGVTTADKSNGRYVHKRMTTVEETDIYGVKKLVQTPKEYWYMDDKGQFICGHAYAIAGIDKAKQTVTIANPHDTSKPLTITYDEFHNIFRKLVEVKMT